MIQINYTVNNKGKHLLTVKGHAGQNAKGQDIVCAGVSTLVTTLVICLNAVTAKNGMLKKPKIKLEQGDAYIDVTPKTRQRNEVKRAFMQTVIGLEWLAKSYPEYVKFVTSVKI